MDNLITPEEIARRLSVSPRQVKDIIRRGKMKAVKVGKFWRVHEKDLNEFIRINTTKSVTNPDYSPAGE